PVVFLQPPIVATNRAFRGGKPSDSPDHPASDVLSVLVSDPIAPAWRVAGEFCERASDRACAALDAVPEADQRLLLLRVPLVHAGGAEVRAVLARALGEAHVLVDDLDVRLARVLVVLDGEELVGELVHQLAPKRSQTRHMRRTALM